MINGLKPYREYKESGLAWLGNIPSHWDIRRLKYILRENDLRSLDGKEQLLRVSQYTGVTQRLRKEGATEQNTRAKSLVGYKIVRPEELVINIMLAWNGSMGVSKFSGIASPAYCVYQFGTTSNPWYFHHILRSPSYLARIKASSTGVIESRLRLYSDHLFRIEAPLPPPDEQVAIVRFLDHANQRIDRFIRTKKKVIALLNEQKQAIIHRAVTRGIDPDVKLKDSGIPWLGEIPENWEVISIGAATNLIQTGPFGSQLHSHEYTNNGIPVINPSHMRDGQIIADPSVTVNEIKTKELDRHRLCVNDIIAARRGELGRCAVVSLIEVGWICGTGSLLIRCKASVFTSNYFQQVFSSKGVRDTLSLASIGATMDNLNAGMVARLRFPFPPLKEQEAIISFVEDHRRTYARTLSIVEREIELIREYRTRLIADVVTGKVDVREAARNLPVTSEEISFEPDTEDLEEESELESETSEAIA